MVFPKATAQKNKISIPLSKKHTKQHMKVETLLKILAKADPNGEVWVKNSDKPARLIVSAIVVEPQKTLWTCYETPNQGDVIISLHY